MQRRPLPTHGRRFRIRSRRAAFTISLLRSCTEAVGCELFRPMLKVVNGRRIWAERWKLHNALVPFDPAPVT
jgi:altronate dehydratase